MSKQFDPQRPWGAAMDASAASQLGVGPEWTITMSSLTATCDDALDDPSWHPDDLLSFDEALDLIKEHLVEVPLPKGWWLVRMSPMGQDSPQKMGLIQWAPVEIVAAPAPQDQGTAASSGRCDS